MFFSHCLVLLSFTLLIIPNIRYKVNRYFKKFIKK
nr:MAG TPA: hypothetical protein [Caudoviricetes sp.]